PAVPGGVLREDEAHRQRRAGRVGMTEGAAKSHVKIIAKNRRALFDYHVESRVEAGISLTGTEVKSLREGSAQLSDSYANAQHGARWNAPAGVDQRHPGASHDPRLSVVKMLG